MSIAEMEDFRKRLRGEIPQAEKEAHNLEAMSMIREALKKLNQKYGTILLPKEFVDNKKLKDELLATLPKNFPYQYVSLDELLGRLEGQRRTGF